MTQLAYQEIYLLEQAFAPLISRWRQTAAVKAQVFVEALTVSASGRGCQGRGALRGLLGLVSSSVLLRRQDRAKLSS